jgi:hypothetical protein
LEIAVVAAKLSRMFSKVRRLTMIGGGISLFGFDLFGPVRKVIANAREEARLKPEAFARTAKEDHDDQETVERDDNVTLFWSVHFAY